jgi:hypothetical protein
MMPGATDADPDIVSGRPRITAGALPMPHSAMTEADAHALDAADPLGRFRERFFIPPGTIQLDGNSLGLLSRDAEAAVLDALERIVKPSSR